MRWSFCKRRRHITGVAYPEANPVGPSKFRRSLVFRAGFDDIGTCLGHFGPRVCRGLSAMLPPSRHRCRCIVRRQSIAIATLRCLGSTGDNALLFCGSLLSYGYALETILSSSPGLAPPALLNTSC